MAILYNIVFLIFAITYIPYLLLTGRYHKDFIQRFGVYSRKILDEIKDKDVIWLHAVSVGEVIASQSFCEGLIRKYSSKKRLVISTVTKTGNGVAKKLFGERATIVYLPLDISWIIEKVLDKFKVRAFLIVETEIWPNLITCIAKRNIPVILINGRISPRSFKNYIIVLPFIKPVLEKISLFCMQNQDYAEKIKALGAIPERVIVTGNMKFDVAIITMSQSSGKDSLMNELGLEPTDSVFIAGSTHPGEDEIILDVYRQLLDDYRDLKLIIAPRHIERTKDIEELAQRAHFTPIRISRAGRDTRSAERYKEKIMILDTMGSLSRLYSIATVVFMGGSLVHKGGQNFLEAAVYAKPIIFGPNMFNFPDMTKLFLDRNAACMVKDKEALWRVSKNLLADHQERYNLGLRAKEAIEENIGASQRNLERLEKFL